MLFANLDVCFPPLTMPIHVIRVHATNVSMRIPTTIFKANGTESAATRVACNRVAPLEVHECLSALRTWAFQREDVIDDMCKKRCYGISMLLVCMFRFLEAPRGHTRVD